MSLKITKAVRPSWAWNLHSHSKFSANDALPDVRDMVATVKALGQPALGLTDHGNMAGSVQLYTESTKAGILPFPGTELYIVRDRNDKHAKRHHMCVVSFTTQGYENLVRLNTLAHTNFHHKPLIDHADLAAMADAGLLRGIAATSGCFFSLISQSLISEDVAQVQSLVASYDKWFDKFYIELQNHNIQHDNFSDDSLADSLWGIAQHMGIPCVVTQDAHYCAETDKETHDALKRLVAFGSDSDDAVFPGDGFHLASQQWFEQHHHDARLSAGREGLADLLGAHALSIPELDSYSYNIPFTVADPMEELRGKCFAALAERDLADNDYYGDRLVDEFEVIEATNMAGYLLLVAEVTDWCRDNRIFYQARGSASGSIVCWLLGITQADPIKWNLRFERFLSKDRTKPPDIDLDVEHERRGELIDWLSQRFAVNQIGTWMAYALTGEDTEFGESKGSLRVRYYARARATGSSLPEWSDVPTNDKEMLRRIADTGAFSGYGVHAAGLVVTTSDTDFDRLVPLMKVASSDTLVSQYEMSDIEKLGLVKLDVLGLKTLSVLHKTMDNLGRDVFEGLDWIPLNDKETLNAISEGNTAGVFQLEGYAAKRGCKDLKPNKVEDVIAAMALFRPATMNSGATADYIARKSRKEKVPDRHKILKSHTSYTYGIVLYQEQVIGILRDLGFDAEDLTVFLKAVKASNADIGSAGSVIAGYKERVLEFCMREQMTKDDFNWLWSAIEGFAEYGFNQAHATAYGITAYRCAYLATHHSMEFHAALLAVAASSDKEERYIKATRAKSIKVLKADVNYSGVTYAPDPKGKGIRKGLLSLKGIGEKAALEIITNRPSSGYDSVEHLCRLVNHRKITGVKAFLEDNDMTVGTLGKLFDHGALDSLLQLERAHAS